MTSFANSTIQLYNCTNSVQSVQIVWCLHKLLGIKWYHHGRNDEVRRTTGQPRLSAIVQARRLSLFGHTARMPDETDAKKIIQLPLRRTGGDHQDVLELHGWRLSSKTSLPGWGDNCGSESSTLDTDVCVWRYAPLVVHATQEEEEEIVLALPQSVCDAWFAFSEPVAVRYTHTVNVLSNNITGLSDKGNDIAYLWLVGHVHKASSNDV